MQMKDLDAVANVPFPVWVKDEEWRYLWGNRAIDDLARESVAGKKDSELVWKANAEALVKNDEEVLATGKPHYIHERVDHSITARRRSACVSGSTNWTVAGLSSASPS